MTAPITVAEWVGLCVTEGDPNWWDNYLDLDEDGDPTETPSQRLERHAKAKEVCGRCRFQDKCAAATDLEKDDGIRFGQLIPELRTGRSHRRKTRFDIVDDGRRSA